MTTLDRFFHLHVSPVKSSPERQSIFLAGVSLAKSCNRCLSAILFMNILFLFLSVSLSGSETLTFTATFDNFIMDRGSDSAVKDRVYSNSADNGVGNQHFYTYSYDYLRTGSLIYFDLSTLIGQTVQSAALQLSVKTLAGDPSGAAYRTDYKLYAIAESWNTNTVTWGNQPQVFNDHQTIFEVPNSGSIPTTIDVTPIVQNWTSGFWPNLGFTLTDAYFETHFCNCLDATIFHTMESGGTPPKLIVSIAGAVDSDGDGVPDDQDAFPNDPNETTDTDGDGIGNNADTDDDNDGMPDSWEITYNLNPLSATDAGTDSDSDGYTNLEEYNAGTNPRDPNSIPDSVSFPDQHLEACIRDALEIPTAPLTSTEVETLTSLTCPSMGGQITDITGIAQLRNLTSLNLESHNVTNLSPLIGLNQLGWLNLSFNPNLSDINPLVNLEATVVQLNLSVTDVIDISPLSGFGQLTSLTLASSGVADISSLANLNNLTSLNLYNTLITDILPLTSLDKLEYLQLDLTRISDTSPLATLMQLRSLSMSNLVSVGGRTPDLAPLTGLTNLTQLKIAGNHLCHIRDLAGLVNLSYLNVSHNPISDLTPLAGLGNLSSLNVMFCRISDFSSVSHVSYVSGAGFQDTQCQYPYYFPDLDDSNTVDLVDAIIGLQVLTGVGDSSLVSDYPNSGADVDCDCKLGLPEVFTILRGMANPH